ncbi:MAG: Ig-like domain-containing protein [Endomicrobiia bacterium]|nr:Ig-like domain-containing protein [Endomicrobiia bacterium]
MWEGTLYFVDASGINGDNQPGNPYVVGSTYTLISAPTDLNFVLYQTSVSVACAGVNFGVWSDSTAVRMSEVVKSTDSGWIKQDNWVLSGLAPNSTYFITAETRNGSGIIGGSLSKKATTYIERVEGIEFIVEQTSIQARVSQTGYTGIAEGQSGVKIWCITKSSETQWSKSPAQWWTLDENIIGIERNQQIVFYADAKNRDGVAAGQTPNISTYTLCETPDIAALEVVSSDTIKTNINRKENSSTNSQFALEITSAPGYTFIKYVSTSGVLSDAPVWGTYSQFGGAAGRNIVGLQPNLEYRLRVKARNGSQIETPYSATFTTATRIESPAGINLEVVGSTYIAASPLGNFSRLADGAASVQIYSVSPSTDGGWRKNQTAWNFVGTSALAPNTEYTLGARVRNIYGSINPTEVEITTRTRSGTPGYNSSIINSSSSITARWTAAGNPFGVNYLSECSSVSVGGLLISSSGWLTDTEYAFGVLAPNTKYHFRARSRDDAGNMSDWRVLDSSYTRVEQPVSVAYDYIGQSSVTINAPGALTNLGVDQSKISFEVAETGDWDQIKSSSNWITQNGFSAAANLAANTTYWVRLKVRNGDGIENSYVTSAKATRIENITQLQFVVDASNNVKVAPLPPDYTSLADGASGIRIYETTLSTSSEWRSATDYWTLAGLSPNQQYTFNAKIRNRAGLENALTLNQATWTLSNIAAAPTLTAVSTGTLNAVVNENSNPSHTQFAVEYSSRSDWTPSYYVNVSGQSSDTPVWLTREEWGGVSPGRDIFNLAPNRQYRARVYSRNVAGISRSASSFSLKYTLVETPTSFIWTNVGFTSVQLKASPEPSNLTYGGILFEVDGGNPQSSGWQSGISANNWTFNNLSTNTLLDFGITTKNGDNIPNSAVSFAKATRIEPPAALTTEEIATTSLKLKAKSSNADESFTNLAAGQSGVYFYGLNVSTDSGWLKETTWTLTGLAPSTKYIFNVKARNHDATIESGPLAGGVTFYTAPGPVNVTYLSTGTPADTAILLKISSGTNGIEAEYQVAVSTVNNFASGTTYYADAASGNLSVSSNTTWGTHYLWSQDSGGRNFAGLSGNTIYYFKARAKNPQNTVSQWSGINQQSTNSSAPDNLVPTALSSTTIRLTWTGVGPKYQVERATWNAPAGVPAETNGWTRIMDWSASAIINDSSLAPAVRRWYRVRAGDIGDIGVSNWASSVNTYTFAAAPAPAVFANVSSSEIRANWTSGGNPAGTEYAVFVSSLGVGVSTITSYGYTTDLNSQLFQTLDLNTTYYFWARAISNNIESPDCVLGSTSTLCAAPGAPTFIAASTHTIWVGVNDAGNPPSSKYALRISSPNGQQKFIQTTGQLGDSAVWRTKAEWEVSGSTAAGLLTNTSYFVQAAAQNNNGVATTFSAGSAKYTYTAVPSTGSFTVWTTSITAGIAPAGNPQNTFYQVRLATHSQITGSVENADGIDITSGTFVSLDPNRSYWFWARAKNGDNIWSDHASFGAKYTRIETASNMSFAVHWTSLSVTATDTFTSLGEGESRIILREVRTVQSSTHTSSANLSWTCDGTLTPNTTYGFSVQSFNGDGLANPESAVTVKATRIESPTGLEFTETSTWYVKVAPKNEFSSLNVGSSGVELQRTNAAGTANLDTSDYQTSTSAWTNAGLDAARVYYYRARSKNRDDLPNAWAMLFSTHTRANPPAPGSPSIPGRGVDFIEVNWYDNNNSTYTSYMVEGSSLSYGGAPTNSSDWLLNTTYYLLNLIPNTSYYLRVKAKNAVDVESAWTQLGTAWTKIETVAGISFDGVFRTSATISALGGPFTKAGAALSGVSIGVYKDEFYTDLRSSKPYDASSEHTFVNLVANTTYYFTANSRSGDGDENVSTGTLSFPISRITLIERPVGVKFGVVSNTSIQAAPDGDFTNLASTGSGVITYSVAPSTESGWRNTTSYFTVSGLSPNTVYNFKADSRNRAGAASGQTLNISTYTLASSPLASVFTEITTSTLRASWTAGLPANPENTEYYVEASSVSQSGPYNYHDGWQTSIYRDFDNLSSNIKYYFRVKSRNFAYAESAWVDLGMKYTLIEQVTSADYTVYPASISVAATPQPSNLDEGSSGIIFTNLTTGVNSGWISNINYTFGSLLQNATYQFRVNTKNGDGISNTAYNLPLACTLIIPATGVAFGNFSATSIEAKASGDFPSNLGAGLSALAVEVRNADLDYSSHVWVPSLNTHAFVGLSTNTLYNFRANTRNQFGATTSSTSWITKYTLAVVPGLVNVTTTTVANSQKIISVGKDGNPDLTDFAVAISTTLTFSVTNYVQPGGTLDAAPYWASWTSGWASNLTVGGLAPNTTYYFKAVARNGANIVTAFGPTSSKATRAVTPQIVSVEPHSSGPNTKLLVNYSGAAEQYKLWYATYSATQDNLSLVSDWSSSTWTLHQSLDPNKKYYYWVKSRNVEFVESDFSDEVSGWTQASQPASYNPFYSAVSQDSMQVNWTAGTPANPSGAFYKIQRATSSDFGGTLSELSVQNTYYYYDTSLAPNRRYFFRVAARNNADIPVWTQFTDLNQPSAGRATLIESPSGITVPTEFVTATALRITADGEFFNLTNPDGGNSSAINLMYSSNAVTGVSRGYGQQSYWDITGLTPNTTYTFSAVSKNWDNIPNNWIPYTSTTATRIESPTGAEFIVSTMTIQSRPIFASGPTNIATGAAGIKHVRGAVSLPDDDLEYVNSTSTWRTWSGLNPNALYTFQIRTRNRQGLLNDWVTGFSTYTRCVNLSAPTVADGTGLGGGSGYYTETTIGYGDNPVGPNQTEFAVLEVSGNKWLDGAGGTQVGVLWSTATVWYHYNLANATTYFYQAKARNKAGIETVLSSSGSATTGPGAVDWIKCVYREVQVEGELYQLKWDWSDVAGANYYEIEVSTNGVNYTAESTALTTSYYSSHYPDRANQKYWARSRGKQNIGGGLGGWSPSTFTYTQIERAQFVELDVTASTQIALRARSIVDSAPAGFSRIQEGSSGISYWCSTAPAVGPAVFSSSVSWTQTTSYFLLPTSLTPNTTYYFKAQSRNALGDVMAPSSVADSTVTWANAPATPALVVSTSDTLKIAVSTNSNPSHTLYAIYLDIPVERYVNAAGNAVSVTPVWRTYSDWNGGAGIVVGGLVKSTEYKVKSRAQNSLNILTAWSPTLTAYTLGGQPIIENTSPGSTPPVWTNVSTWKFKASNSDSYRYLWNKISDSVVEAASSDPWNGSTEITRAIDSEGSWYFHVAGFSGDPASKTGQTTYGPIRYDNTAPTLGALSAQKSASDPTVIEANQWTRVDTPYFYWTEPYSGGTNESPISGYSVTFSSNPDINPVAATNTTNTYYEVSTPLTDGGVWYFKVRAKDSAGNWSGVGAFVYKFNSGTDRPSVTSLNPAGRLINGEWHGANVSSPIAATFDRAMDKESTETALELYAIRDKNGNTIFANISGVTLYNTQTYQALFTPNAPLLKNYTYRIVVTVAAKDSLGNNLASASEVVFRTILDENISNTVIASDEKTKVELENGATTAPIYVVININPAASPIKVNPESMREADSKVAASDKQGFTKIIGGSAREFVAYTAAGGQVTTFDAPVVITMPYEDSDRNGVVDGTSPGILAKMLKIVYLNENTREWEALESVVDTNKRVVTAQTKHFSVYALKGSPSKDVAGVYAYPIPFDTAEGHTKINFGKVPSAPIPSSGKIRIYTLTGSLVKEQEINDGAGIWSWDVKTESNQPVASGVYIYVIENSDGVKKIGKLMVIR